MDGQIPGQVELLDYLSEVEEQKGFDILDYIPTGYQNAVKRSELVQKTGLSDRVMRDCLHDARTKIPIINLQRGNGYFIADMNQEEEADMLVRWVRQEKSRIKESQEIVDTAIKTLENCGIDWR